MALITIIKWSMQSANSKVNHSNFRTVWLGKHNVAQLKVSMNDSLLVAVVDALNELVKNFKSFIFVQSPSFLKIAL